MTYTLIDRSTLEEGDEDRTKPNDDLSGIGLDLSIHEAAQLLGISVDNTRALIEASLSKYPEVLLKASLNRYRELAGLR